jgi:hypothetical protein
MHVAFNSPFAAGMTLIGVSAVAIAQLPAPLLTSSLPDIALSFDADAGQIHYLTPFAEPNGYWGGMGTKSSASCDLCGTGSQAGDRPADVKIAGGISINGPGPAGGGSAESLTAGDGSSGGVGFGVPLPVSDAGALIGAFGGVLDGLSEAGGALLNALADQITMGAGLFSGTIDGAPALASASLIAAANLLASGVAGGAHSVIELIGGAGGAAGGLGLGIDAVPLPGLATILDAFSAIADAWFDAAGDFLHGSSDGILGGAGIHLKIKSRSIVGLNIAQDVPVSGARSTPAARAGLADTARRIDPRPPTSLATANSIPRKNARLMPVSLPTTAVADSANNSAPASDSDPTASASDGRSRASDSASKVKKSGTDAKASAGGKHRNSGGKAKHAK